MPGVLYSPNIKNPVVGGYSATFSAGLRNIGKGAAIAATKRVLHRGPYEPTGDIAFDIRAQAFRDALMAGTPEAFQESHEAFSCVGCTSWQFEFNR